MKKGHELVSKSRRPKIVKLTCVKTCGHIKKGKTYSVNVRKLDCVVFSKEGWYSVERAVFGKDVDN